MRNVMLSVAALVVAAVTFAAMLGTRAASSGTRVTAVASTCAPAWRNVESPKVAQGTLNGVAALSPTNAWAVGGVVRLGGDTGGEVVSSTRLIEHWNGRR